MSTEEGLLPVGDLRNEAVQDQERRDPPQDHHAEEQEGKSVWEDTELGHVERCEREPGTDVDEAGAIEEEVDHCRKGVVLDLVVEVPIP